RVGGRPGEEDGRDLVAQERQQRRLQVAQPLPPAGGHRVEYGLDQRHYARGAGADDRAGSGVREALVELCIEAEVAERRPAAEEKGPPVKAALEDIDLAVERSLDLILGRG